MRFCNDLDAPALNFERALFLWYNSEESGRFHIESEISTQDTNDSTIVIMVFKYGLEDGLKHKEAGKNKITVKFPQPKVILRSI